MRSVAVDRLNGHLLLDTLPSGGRVSAALGVQVTDGFTHIESCSPIHMPSKTNGKRSIGERKWAGAPEDKQVAKARNQLVPNLDGSGRMHGMSEHLPWEQPR